MNKIKHTKSSGNVYKDLGLSNSEERLAKAQLAMRINEIIKLNEYKQAQAAEILQINQPKVSALMNGQLEGFSMERLIQFLKRLSQDVEIVIKSRKTRKIGRLSVAIA